MAPLLAIKSLLAMLSSQPALNRTHVGLAHPVANDHIDWIVRTIGSEHCERMSTVRNRARGTYMDQLNKIVQLLLLTHLLFVPVWSNPLP